MLSLGTLAVMVLVEGAVETGAITALDRFAQRPCPLVAELEGIVPTLVAVIEVPMEGVVVV